MIQPDDLVLYIPFDDIANGVSADGSSFRDATGRGNDASASDGANDTGMTGEAENVFSYP